MTRRDFPGRDRRRGRRGSRRRGPPWASRPTASASPRPARAATSTSQYALRARRRRRPGLAGLTRARLPEEGARARRGTRHVPGGHHQPAPRTTAAFRSDRAGRQGGRRLVHPLGLPVRPPLRDVHHARRVEGLRRRIPRPARARRQDRREAPHPARPGEPQGLDRRGDGPAAQELLAASTWAPASTGATTCRSATTRLELVEALAPFAINSHIKDMAVEEYADGFLLSEVPLGQGMLPLKRHAGSYSQGAAAGQVFARHADAQSASVPCLTEKYWATFPQRNGVYLARALRMVRANKPATAAGQALTGWIRKPACAWNRPTSGNRSITRATRSDCAHNNLSRCCALCGGR